MADHSFKSAKDLWLGELLPHQQPNLPQAHLLAKLLFLFLFGIHQKTYPQPKGRFLRVTHQFAMVIIYSKQTIHSTRMCQSYR